MNTGFEECDSCGNQIEVDVARQRPRAHDFYLPTKDQKWNSYSFILCTGCQRKIVDWIDELDESEIRVELHSAEDIAEALRFNAKTLENAADELEENLGHQK